MEVQVRLAADKHHVAEPAHRHVRRLLLPKGSDLAVLDQDVVERERKLAVGGRPVVGVRRRHDDVPVEAHLLAVVLADVWVVPVRAGIWHMEPVRERAADRDRGLRSWVPS